MQVKDEFTTERLAEFIVRMSYGELMAFSRSLRDMQEDRNHDLTNVSEWADIIFDWAEATVEAIAEELGDGISQT